MDHKPEDIQVSVHSHLILYCLGKSHAQKARILADHFGLSLREINAVVRDLRKSGHLIGSSKEPPFGYYIPASEQERDEYLNAFKQELFDMLETFRAQRRARRVMLEQQNQICLFKASSNQMELVGI